MWNAQKRPAQTGLGEEIMSKANDILIRGNDYEFTLEMAGTYEDTPIRYEPGVL